MSWGSAATEGTSAAGTTAASNTASTAGSTASTTSTAATVAETGASNTGAGGYSIDAGQAGETANSGGFWDNTMNGLEKFQKGSDQSLPEAYRGWGNNAETYGYVGGKVRGMAAGGGGNQPANVTTNINYQQPENDYLRRRRGY